MDYVLILPVLISFAITLLVLPIWIDKCKKIGLLWEDMNKYNHPRNVASSGGIVVVVSFLLGVLIYLALKTFLFGGSNSSLEIFALISMVLFLGIVGLVDDLLGWRNGGLSNNLRIVLAIVASIPLVVINAGTHFMSFPFLGIVELGIIYPLIFIPIGVAGAATTYNFLAGFNGLEAGQGILILSFFSYVSFILGKPWLSIIGLCMVFSLISFYLFNKYPSKVFPGDVLTYSVGALIAGMAILGNFERIAVFVFLPYIFEVILKLRGNLKKQSFGIPDKKGNLKEPYKKIYGLEHLSIQILNKSKLFGPANERKVVYLIYLVQILFILIAFLML